jgi:hypothetical protein
MTAIAADAVGFIKHTLRSVQRQMDSNLRLEINAMVRHVDDFKLSPRHYWSSIAASGTAAEGPGPCGLHGSEDVHGPEEVSRDRGCPAHEHVEEIEAIALVHREALPDSSE